MPKKDKKIKSLKKLKEELDDLISDGKSDKVYNKINTIIRLYPDNSYGYVKYIEYKTHNYQKYIKDEDDLKSTKLMYEKAYDLLSADERLSFKNNFDEYMHDIKEVSNLSRIKKNIISKLVLLEIENDLFLTMNNSINESKLYNIKGIKLKNIYDLVNGMFLLFCLIYNLIYRNFFLIITIPLGIFGVVNILSFFSMNLLNNKKEISKFKNNFFESAQKRKMDLKKEISKAEENVAFCINEKKSSISKIPESFKKDINDLLKDDEESIKDTIIRYFKSNNYAVLITMLENSTNIELNDIKNIIAKYTDNENGVNNKKMLYMKKISFLDKLLFVFLFVLSAISIVYTVKNFSRYNLAVFLISIVVGIIRIMIFNIEKTKHSSISEVFILILKSTIFYTTLTYNLLFLANSKIVSLAYLFIQVPITFLCVFAFFVMFISHIKYNKLLKKLRNK